MRDQCFVYLKDQFMNFKHPNPEHDIPQEERAEAWDRMPIDNKNMLVDLVLGFNCGEASPALAEIRDEYAKKTHSDASFGMIVKEILYKYRVK